VLYLGCPKVQPIFPAPIPAYSRFFLSGVLPWARRKNMRRFGEFRDERFALTTLQNPFGEGRSYAELVQAAQPGRENQPVGARHIGGVGLVRVAAADGYES
jgi:hypothetical protein